LTTTIAFDALLNQSLEKIIEQCEPYRVKTSDHVQVVGYDGNRPVETAINGITRVGTHSKYGFGEFQLKPVEPS